MSASHDVQLWGELLCREFVQPLELARLADVVRFVQARNGLEQDEAAEVVLLGVPPDRMFLLRIGLGAELLNPGLFGNERVLTEGDMPSRWRALIAEQRTGDKKRAERLLFGLPEQVRQLIPGLPLCALYLRDWLRAVWVEGHDHRTDLDDGIGGRVAMLAQHAAENFGYGLPVLGAHVNRKALTANELSAAYPPEGSEWPHVKAANWTDDERAAMFRMRWLGGASDELIAEAAGVSRQRVAQLIGHAKDWRIAEKWPLAGWGPSAELLRQCGLVAPIELTAAG